MTLTETQASIWELPKAQPDNLDAEALKEWQELTTRVREIARRCNLSKAEVARRTNVPSGTFSPWYDGTYKGVISNVSERVRNWLDGQEEGTAMAALLPTAPDFVDTPTSAKIRDVLLYALLGPEMVIVTTGAGMGKTITARRLQASRPHVHLVTMRPTTATVHGMMQELCQVLEVPERNPARMDRAIGEKLRRNGRQTLLMVDEAQNLQDAAVNQLRYFLDEYGVGVALMGNEEIYGRYAPTDKKPNYAQIHRRIGMRFRRMQPTVGDIEAILGAWEIDDAAVLKLARAIGRKPGALAQITKTIQLAGMLAGGEQRSVTAADVKRAWEDRGGEW